MTSSRSFVPSDRRHLNMATANTAAVAISACRYVPFIPMTGHRQLDCSCRKSADFVAKVGCNGLARGAFR